MEALIEGLIYLALIIAVVAVTEDSAVQKEIRKLYYGWRYR